ncbi:MAG: ABC transporter ATP-binding protein [Thermoplasmatota archaeon]
MSEIELDDLSKVYRTGRMEYQALKDVSLSFEEGELTAIVGPSGCGKSTLLNMITGIDRPTGGTVVVGGERIDRMKEDKLAKWRGKNVGIVFQFFQLFPTLTALENAMLPMDLAGFRGLKERKTMAKKNLDVVGLGEKIDKLPSELSGGEQQRVAIARALANDPKFIIGDEPTGNLDSKTENKMFELLKDLNKEGKTILFVTHSRDLAEKASRKIEMLDGRVI